MKLKNTYSGCTGHIGHRINATIRGSFSPFIVLSIHRINNWHDTMPILVNSSVLYILWSIIINSFGLARRSLLIYTLFLIHTPLTTPSAACLSFLHLHFGIFSTTADIIWRYCGSWRNNDLETQGSLAKHSRVVSSRGNSQLPPRIFSCQDVRVFMKDTAIYLFLALFIILLASRPIANLSAGKQVSFVNCTGFRCRADWPWINSFWQSGRANVSEVQSYRHTACELLVQIFWRFSGIVQNPCIQHS